MALAVVTSLVASLVLAACGNAPEKGEDLFVVSGTINPATGTANSDTARFAPPGAWDLAYSWDCAHADSEGLPGIQGIDAVIYNSDDQSTAFEHPEVINKAPRGKGVLHYQRGGDYYVHLETRCDWTIDVVTRS